MAFDGGITSQAVLTLTTTDTDIRAGEAVDISIASDIDITDITSQPSDITVTGRDPRCVDGFGYMTHQANGRVNCSESVTGLRQALPAQ